MIINMNGGRPFRPGLMVEYAIKKEVYSSKYEHHCTYSVIVENDGAVIDIIEDAFSNEELAESVVAMCNRLQLSHAHIYEVIENAIFDYYCDRD